MGNPILNASQLKLAIPGRAPGMAIDLTIEIGQCWGLLGSNGSGKTTLLHTLAGLRVPLSGHITLHGKPLPRLPRRQIAQSIGLLLQDHQDGFPATVLETALIGRHPYLRPWQWENADDQMRAERALTTLELIDLAPRGVQTLSGGERQRLAIATLLTQDPVLWLLDEPTNHLDLRHQVAVLNLIQHEVQAQRRAVVMALHDVNHAFNACSHLILLYPDGGICTGTTESLFRVETLERLLDLPLQVLQQRDEVWIRPAGLDRRAL